MTENLRDAERLITWRGREIAVRFPTDAMLMVWRRTVRDLQQQDSEKWDTEEALTAMERAGKIIDSVIVDRTDRAWLDDITLDEGLSLADRAEIINLTVKAFGADTEGKPAKKATPAKRARRKAA